MTSRKYAAVVVGAGPAGVAAVGTLLERQLGTIAWIDPTFDAGRVHRKYREVPSNTKVSLFQAYATAVQPFQTILDNARAPNAFSAMAKLDQDKTCHLHYAADMTRALTDGLIEMEQVDACRGFVTAANLSESRSQSHWTVRTRRPGLPDELEIETSRLILCTGSHPTNPPIPVSGLSIHRLDLDTVLKPSELSCTLPTNHPLTIAVVGASHSAILSLLNLLTLARTSHPHLRIRWFTRHALRYAEYKKEGWILRDNTGLKGQAADFARSQLEDDKLHFSEAGQFIQKINCKPRGDQSESDQFHAHLPSCSHILHAVGFTRDPLPHLSRNGVPLSLQFDHESGRFYEQAGDEPPVIPGLYGAGIAFPERVVDPYGNVEHAVGFFKFIKFLKRVCPTWEGA